MINEFDKGSWEKRLHKLCTYIIREMGHLGVVEVTVNPKLFSQLRYFSHVNGLHDEVAPVKMVFHTMEGTVVIREAKVV
jgi:hypothetical protein